jgi:chitin synthase
MAYRQNHDPYYAQQQQPMRQNTQQPYQQQDQYYDTPQQPQQRQNYQQPQPYQQPPPQQQYQPETFHQPDPYYDQGHAVTTDYASGEQAWDGKSYQDSYAGSQTHLDPYGQSQASIPPVPSMPYAPASNYPPQRPGMPYNGSGYGSGYSAVHEKMMKRRSVRQVELFQGNLVLDMPVASHIVPAGKANIEEFSKMRYTAATCDPDDFMRSKYSLRPFLYNRQTELFIVMTMYNEDEVLFCRTMNAVIKNIAHLCGRDRSKMWGPDGWKKVVVCVVSDGRSKVNKRTLQVLSLMGCYQDGIAKDTVGGKDVTAHIFEVCIIQSVFVSFTQK